ncbi:MAG TPA: glycosyltransferase family 1 protein [Gemmatimonadaceae bacterium]|nr:glycosyltransferase family 1 protein [Gemmatimonadaceae bacterium]
MRIAFNGQRLAGQRLGVGRYIEYMLRYWSRMLEPSEEVTLFLRRKLDPAGLAYLGLSDRIRPKVLSPDVSGIVWENLRLGFAASGTDVLFCPAYTAPLVTSAPLVVATHSVNEIQPAAQSRWHSFTYSKLYRRSALRAERVIVPCETTRQDVASFYGVDPKRIAVVEQGSDDSFRPIDDAAVLTSVRKRFFDGNRPFILFAGKCSTRRNIPMLIRAFAQLKHSHNLPHGLLLFGPNPDGLPLRELCKELGVADSVVQDDGQIRDHSELVAIYNAADLFVHPSEFEGWSMTTVEAMGCGTAVVAVDRGGLGEVARGHAFMIDQPTVESLAHAIHTVLSDDTLRQSLKAKALARGSALRWSDTTRRTLDVVRTVGAH